LVEVCPWNYVLNSNATWAATNVTITSGVTDASGGTNAYNVSGIDTGNVTDYAGKNTNPMSIIANNSITFSIYMKGSGTIATYIERSISGTYFFDSKIHTLSSEWQRFTHTYTPTSDANGMSVLVGNLTGTTATSVDICFPQVNYGSTAKPYFPTTDRLNVPRLTYQNGGGGCPSLLLEKQSTNLFTYSEQFDNAAWTKLNSTITANSTTSPDGTQNADSINDTTSNSRHVIEEPITGDLSLSRAMSLYAKQNTLRYLYMSVTDAGDFNCYSAIFDLQSGTVSATKINGSATITAKIESVGNGWYRCAITGTMTSGTATFYPLIGTSDRPGFTGTLINNNAPSYAGSGQSLYIWGAQLEASSYPTSYIPTTSASATRVADACFKTGISSLIGQTEGAIFVEINRTQKSENYQPVISLQGASSAQLIELYFGSANTLILGIYNSGAQYQSASGVISNGTHKIAIAYKQNDFAYYIDGVQISTDNSGTVPALSQFALGTFTYTTGYELSDGIKQALLFKTRLTNAELASLTTI
jgi:hypothetical protein